MIVDTMSKLEVIKSLRTDFDREAKPYFDKKWNLVNRAMYSEVIRKKQTIRKEFEYVSSNNIKFYCLFIAKSIKSDPAHEFVVEFDWNKRHCYASFYQNDEVLIIQGHCIDRYIERVLKKQLPKREVFYKHLLPNQASAFKIALPTPTHECSEYFGSADALFLGDFDPEIINSDSKGSWYNTCISLKEAGETQSKIINTLHSLQSFVKNLTYNPIEYNGLQKNHALLVDKDFAFRDTLIDFYKKSYMLLCLHESFDFSFTKLDEDFKIDKLFLESELINLGVNPLLLSPYSLDDGIAMEGEIDYKGNKE